MSSYDCIFCNIEEERIVDQNNACLVIRDLYPVTELHTLIISQNHVESIFELSEDEMKGFVKMLKKQKDILVSKDPTIKAFNIGINDGVQAGQTIPHLHIHLIPRRDGDVDDPRGGVRGVIPSKQNYEK